MAFADRVRPSQISHLRSPGRSTAPPRTICLRLRTGQLPARTKPSFGTNRRNESTDPNGIEEWITSGKADTDGRRRLPNCDDYDGSTPPTGAAFRSQAGSPTATVARVISSPERA